MSSHNAETEPADQEDSINNQVTAAKKQTGLLNVSYE